MSAIKMRMKRRDQGMASLPSLPPLNSTERSLPADPLLAPIDRSVANSGRGIREMSAPLPVRAVRLVSNAVRRVMPNRKSESVGRLAPLGGDSESLAHLAPLGRAGSTPRHVKCELRPSCPWAEKSPAKPPGSMTPVQKMPSSRDLRIALSPQASKIGRDLRPSLPWSEKLTPAPKITTPSSQQSSGTHCASSRSFESIHSAGNARVIDTRLCDSPASRFGSMSGNAEDVAVGVALGVQRANAPLSTPRPSDSARQNGSGDVASSQYPESEPSSPHLLCKTVGSMAVAVGTPIQQVARDSSDHVTPNLRRHECRPSFPEHIGEWPCTEESTEELYSSALLSAARRNEVLETIHSAVYPASEPPSPKRALEYPDLHPEGVDGMQTPCRHSDPSSKSQRTTSALRDSLLSPEFADCQRPSPATMSGTRGGSVSPSDAEHTSLVTHPDGEELLRPEQKDFTNDEDQSCVYEGGPARKQLQEDLPAIVAAKVAVKRQLHDAFMAERELGTSPTTAAIEALHQCAKRAQAQKLAAPCAVKSGKPAGSQPSLPMCTVSAH
eukprot:TRINITY_DN46357_c0_g1_i1.p1 TRINITY_DN46357_c0_g1~~TRINITY_DN46357_c0_g1_i1.p1  ORF type:complete len:577 (+),score=49.51 TRINITY_DN46357_c0_g1_i1:70-1731(+)